MMWKVVPLSWGQLLDVDPEDILDGGNYRQCNTYKGGGGYDRFPELAHQFFDEPGHNLQFVVQLFGCNLDCPYCYVTREGVWGQPIRVSTEELVAQFNQTQCSVFHLMGGAPALQLPRWGSLLSELEQNGKPGWLFHSDLMLTERRYTPLLMESIANNRALYAINIKGVTEESHLANTRKPLDVDLFWENMRCLIESDVNHYITFTGIDQKEWQLFWNLFIQRFGLAKASKELGHSFQIDLKDYKASSHVDDIEWGRRNELD